MTRRDCVLHIMTNWFLVYHTSRRLAAEKVKLHSYSWLQLSGLLHAGFTIQRSMQGRKQNCQWLTRTTNIYIFFLWLTLICKLYSWSEFNINQLLNQLIKCVWFCFWFNVNNVLLIARFPNSKHFVSHHHIFHIISATGFVVANKSLSQVLSALGGCFKIQSSSVHQIEDYSCLDTKPFANRFPFFLKMIHNALQMCHFDSRHNC